MIITPHAKSLFIDYIKNHIIAKKHETKCSKINNIINDIDSYFDFELKEKDHKDIVAMIIKNKGVMSANIMRRWISENYNENYIKKTIDCD